MIAFLLPWVVIASSAPLPYCKDLIDPGIYQGGYPGCDRKPKVYIEMYGRVWPNWCSGIPADCQWAYDFVEAMNEAYTRRLVLEEKDGGPPKPK